MHKSQCCFGGVISTLYLYGGFQFGFKDGGEVIVPVFLEFTGFTIKSFKGHCQYSFLFLLSIKHIYGLLNFVFLLDRHV